jgi:hypothetical protein
MYPVLFTVLLTVLFTIFLIVPLTVLLSVFLTVILTVLVAVLLILLLAVRLAVFLIVHVVHADERGIDGEVRHCLSGTGGFTFCNEVPFYSQRGHSIPRFLQFSLAALGVYKGLYV